MNNELKAEVTPSSGGENKPMLAAVLSAIYWKKFTPMQENGVLEIINDKEMNAMSKANDICDFLGIERRGNRSAISDVLSNGR